MPIDPLPKVISVAVVGTSATRAVELRGKHIALMAMVSFFVICSPNDVSQ